MPTELDNLEVDEVSLVDTGANQGALSVLFKRELEIDGVIDALKKSYQMPKASFAEALADRMMEDKRWMVSEKMMPLFDALRESTEKIMTDGGKDVESRLKSEVGSFIEMALKTVMEGGDPESEPGPDDEADKTIEAQKGDNGDAGSPSDTNPSNDGGSMDLEELEKKLGEQEEMNALLTKALKDNGFTVSESGEVTKAAEPEFIMIDGDKVEKSLIPAPLLKKLEKDSERLQALEKKQESESLAKRAEETYPNLAGSPVQKGQLVKAVDGIEDEETRTEVEAALKAADAAVGKLFEMVGSDNNADNSESGHAKLTKMAEEAVNKGEFDTVAKAYTHLMSTPEGRELIEADRD